ncbi:hypothetical protein [Streptomyces sp. NPDC057545]|uniref:hypothetical protein n=1 Tax=Streptomyces sp. NPDC057545 TaxID=3346164 RepID=UPI00367DFD3A
MHAQKALTPGTRLAGDETPSCCGEAMRSPTPGVAECRTCGCRAEAEQKRGLLHITTTAPCRRH